MEKRDWCIFVHYRLQTLLKRAAVLEASTEIGDIDLNNKPKINFQKPPIFLQWMENENLSRQKSLKQKTSAIPPNKCQKWNISQLSNPSTALLIIKLNPVLKTAIAIFSSSSPSSIILITPLYLPSLSQISQS